MTRNAKKGVSLRPPRATAGPVERPPKPPRALSVQEAKQADRERERRSSMVTWPLPCIRPKCSTVAALVGYRDEPEIGLRIRAPFVYHHPDVYELTGDRSGGYGAMGMTLEGLPEEITIVCRRGHRTPLRREGLQEVAAMLRLDVAAEAAE